MTTLWADCLATTWAQAVNALGPSRLSDVFIVIITIKLANFVLIIFVGIAMPVIFKARWLAP